MPDAGAAGARQKLGRRASGPPVPSDPAATASMPKDGATKKEPPPTTRKLSPEGFKAKLPPLPEAAAPEELWDKARRSSLPHQGADRRASFLSRRKSVGIGIDVWKDVARAVAHENERIIGHQHENTRETAHNRRHTGLRVVVRQDTTKDLDPDNQDGKKKLPKKTVYVRYDIFNLYSINTSSQQFCVKLNLECTWSDPTLNGKEENDIDWANVWKPNHQRYVNLFDLASTGSVGKPTYCLCNWEDHRNGHAIVSSYSTVAGTFLTDMDLTNFPFDAQELLVQFTFKTRDYDIQFALNPFRPSTQDQINSNLTEWKSYDPCVTCYYQKETDMPIFQVHLRMKRLSQFYWQTIMLPIAVITLSSWGTFCANVTHMIDRLTIILTLVTITTAFKLISIGNLPKINYQTLLDEYLLYNLLFQMSIMFWVCLTTRFSSVFQMDLDADSDFQFDDVDHYMKVGTMKQADNCFLVSSLGAWVLMHIWVVGRIFRNIYGEIEADRNLTEHEYDQAILTKARSGRSIYKTKLKKLALTAKNRIGPVSPPRGPGGNKIKPAHFNNRSTAQNAKSKS